MSANLLYFASLRERFGSAGEALELPVDGATVKTLVDSLRARGGPWAEGLSEGRAWRVAVNQAMASLDTPVRDGDEVAFFPPVTGG
ncbi:MAG TPA: molybdopterin converting factor subunit 1 [Usitatibacteraceae bacterium]|nr:molybdopterin converting factor subunit 1 [Usitatibacteraceae bacterium]